MDLVTLATTMSLLALLGLLVGLLEHTHRRAMACPTAFRPNAAAADADLRRLQDDLSARAAASSGPPPQRPKTPRRQTLRGYRPAPR